MKIAARLARNLKDWIKSRPRLEIDESATWFLLLFAYAHGLTTDGLGFKTTGIIPQLTAPQLTLAMTLFCLFGSVVVLMEPLLPCKARTWTKAIRCSSPSQYIRRISVFFAFVLGMAAGFSLLIDKVPTLSWLIVSVAYLGFLIFVVMGVKLFVFDPIRHLHLSRSGEHSSRRVTP